MNTDGEVLDHLEHFGVKGMRWGVRNEQKEEKRFLKDIRKSGIHIYNDAAGAMNNGVQSAINNKPEYKGKDFNKPSALRTKYYNESAQAMAGQMNKALEARVGSTSSSGTYKAEFLVESGNGQPYLHVVKTDVQHSDESLRFDVKTDATGHILSYVLSDGKLVQTNVSEDGEAFIVHYGIKGMRWGIIRSQPTTRQVSTDGKRAEKIQSKAKTRGIRSLTNNELKDYNKRVQMEQQYSKLQPAKKNVINEGHKFVKEGLAIAGTAASVYAFSKSPFGKKLMEQFSPKSKPFVHPLDLI